MTNTIIRAPRRNRFLVIGQRTIEDARISWAARGLLAYLLSRPDNWKVLIKDLQVVHHAFCKLTVALKS